MVAVSVATVLLSNTLAAKAETWNLGTGGSWNTAVNWNPASIPNAIGANATFNNAASGSNPAQTASGSVVLDGSKTVGSITFNNDGANAFTYSIANGTGGPLVFDETGSGPATITVPAVAGTGNNTISATVTLTDSLVATVNNITASSAAGALNLTTAMSGPGGFTKQGDGLATFGTGAKTYAGPTVVNGGRMRISFAARPSATSSFTVNAGGQLNLISGSAYAFGSGPLNLNGSGATTGPFAAFPGAIRNDRGIGTVTISNAVVLQSDTLIHVQAAAGTGASALPGATNILVGAISGPGRLTLTAPSSDLDQGLLVLTASNSYAGGSFINGGILVASGSTATFGAGNVTVDNTASPVSIARLRIESGVGNAIADTATLSLAGGGSAGVADQGYADLGTGVNETVGNLILAGSPQVAGTYGSTTSAATFQNNEFFSGSGIITVVVAPTLTIALNTPDVLLSWPTNATGFVLQGLAAFSGMNVWTNMADPIVVSGTNNTVTVGASSGNKFFRLKN